MQRWCARVIAWRKTPFLIFLFTFYYSSSFLSLSNSFIFTSMYSLAFTSRCIVDLIPMDVQHDNILNICCITLPRYVNWNILVGKLLIASLIYIKQKERNKLIRSVRLYLFHISRIISFRFEIQVLFSVSDGPPSRHHHCLKSGCCCWCDLSTATLHNLCLWLTPWTFILHIFALSWFWLLTFRPNQSWTILISKSACNLSIRYACR